ncbi:ADP-heptose:LPS heptosyltransferase [Thermocatellispora tengchongensis]|uniref:ADP-heptose:LPS heptosyltransferase n=1 Tax=Thermocatellispora tengchongensis TaxID=1073253 RepID=A0A840PBV3_9ACTN|nr:glycosyltransferase family 9 protein [Thermocatellispora tengchongensis]MBB5136469.1 ADP-heptose:LPS heptosyltransferase [Thermocatellispora tengchongensis]
MGAGAPFRATGTTLVVRTDGAGDVLLAGPAIRAVAARSRRVVLLAGPGGRAAAELLPGVDEVLEWRTPWIDPDRPPMTGERAVELLGLVRRAAPDNALIFTSFHQSALPMALMLRLAGVARIAAISGDYPGALLDVRHVVDESIDVPEPERMLGLATAAGFPPEPGDDLRLAVRRPLPPVGHLTGPPGYVVVHPGVTAPARAWPAERCAEAVRALRAAGYRVVVTGGPDERALTAAVAGGEAVDLGGLTSFAELGAVLDGACAVVVANTGAAHLAAAVRTPVVSLFAPVVPAARWAPYRVPSVLLGDQGAPCAASRARVCPVPGHPCLAGVTAEQVVAAVRELTAPTQRSVTAARHG